MALLSNPITLPASKMLSTMTALLAEVRYRETLGVSDIVDEFVNSARIGNVEYGKGMVYTFKTDILPVKDLTEVSSAFTITKPNVAQDTIIIDKYKFIPLSWSNWLGRDAFTRGYQFDGFFSYIMSLIGETHMFTLYDEVNNLYQNWTPGQESQTVTIDLIDPEGMTGAELTSTLQYNATMIAKVMRKTLNNMKVLNNKFSDVATYKDANDGTTKPVRTALARDNLKIVFNDNFYTDFLGDAMASLYHNEKVGEMLPGENFLLIPTDKMLQGNSNVIAWLSDKQKFAMADFYQVQMAIRDPSTTYDNNFFHFAYGTGVFKYMPGVRFLANYVKPTTPGDNG